MFKTLQILGFLVISFCSLNGQNLSKEYVDNWLTSTFPDFQVDDRTLYVLNGILYAYDEIDSKLTKYSQNELIIINKADQATIDSSIIFHPKTKIVLLGTSRGIKKKNIRAEFENAKKLFFKPESDSIKNMPVLIINNKQVDPINYFDTINDIKLSKVLGVNIIDKPVSIDKYGSNGVNGLVIIKSK